MTDGAAYLLRGDARRIPLTDETIDLIVTSPPFFALRSYTDAGEHYPGQIGDEPTPAEFLANLWAATREMARVLKPSGSIWLELGDKYNSAASNQNGAAATTTLDPRRGPKMYRGDRGTTTAGIRPKSLLGLPWAYALGCTGALAMLGGPDPGLNLILRAEIIHEHTNGLPESVKDRVRRSHSTWFHLTKSSRYYSAVDEVREPHSAKPDSLRKNGETQRGHDRRVGHGNNGFGWAEDAAREYNPLGKLPGSVWSLPSEPLRVPKHLGIDHYAAFSSEIVRRIVLGWSPPGICLECEQGRVPVVDRRYDTQGRTTNGPQSMERRHLPDGSAGFPVRAVAEATIVGYACACTPSTPTGWTAPPTRPSVVLDPFCGTGTTVMVARALGRVGIGLDLSADYLRLASWRVWDSGHWQNVIARTTGRRLPKLAPRDPMQEVLGL